MQLRVNLSTEKRDSCTFDSSSSQCRIGALPLVSRNSRSRANFASNFRMVEALVASKCREQFSLTLAVLWDFIASMYVRHE